MEKELESVDGRGYSMREGSGRRKEQKGLIGSEPIEATVLGNHGSM